MPCASSTGASSSSRCDKSDGNLGKAADTLGVHRNTLTRKIKDLKIKARPSVGVAALRRAVPHDAPLTRFFAQPI